MGYSRNLEWVKVTRLNSENDGLQFKGIWTCAGRIGKHTMGGCGRVNLYVSKYRQLKPKYIDSRCRRCNKRVKFQPRRQDNRGGLRSVGFVWIPNGHEISIEDAFEFMQVSQENRDFILGRNTHGSFRPAIDLVDPRMGGEE